MRFIGQSSRELRRLRKSAISEKKAKLEKSSHEGVHGRSSELNKSTSKKNKDLND